MKPQPRVPSLHSRVRCGFTLVELLAVVAIVGVLAALVLSTLGGMRAKARQAKCGANLRTIASAFNQFAADNQGYYPGVIRDTSKKDGRLNPKGNWWQELTRYLGSDLKTAGSTEGSAFAVCPDGLTGMNSKINYYYQSPRVTIVQPSKTILAGDSKDHVLTLDLKDPIGAVWKHSEPQRHSGQANYLFVDGHVEGLALSAAYKAWNRLPYAQ